MWGSQGVWEPSSSGVCCTQPFAAAISIFCEGSVPFLSSKGWRHGEGLVFVRNAPLTWHQTRSTCTSKMVPVAPAPPRAGRRAGCPFQREGGRAATIPGFHQLSSFPSLVHTPQQAQEGLQVFGFLGFGQTHGITASTCPHLHMGWEKASSQSSLCRADGDALSGTKFGVFWVAAWWWLLLAGHGAVPGQEGKLQTVCNCSKSLLIIESVFQKHRGRDLWVCGSLVPRVHPLEMLTG